MQTTKTRQPVAAAYVKQCLHRVIQDEYSTDCAREEYETMYSEDEEEKIIDALMIHFPDRRRYDVGIGGYTRSLSFALTLSLDKGASWALDNGSLTSRSEWRATINDRPRGYLIECYNKNAALAVCQVWISWKSSIESE